MPQISVIVPVYNVEPYLHRCVDSILCQTFTDFELILVDDGSPDRCGEICDEYAKRDKRIHVIHQRNGGLSAARNAGIDYAFSYSDSLWLTFIDSDDFVHCNYLKMLYTTVKNEQLLIAVGIIAKSVDGVANNLNADSILFYDPDDFWSNDVTSATSACAKIYYKELFKTIRFPIDKLHEDMFVIYKILFSFEQLAVIQPPIYYYCYNPESISNQWSLHRMDSIDALIEQCTFFRENHYKKSELTAAYGLFCETLYALGHLLNSYPTEKKRIFQTRKLLRKTYRKYHNRLNITAGNGKNSYLRYAHPIFYKLMKKIQHLKTIIIPPFINKSKNEF